MEAILAKEKPRDHVGRSLPALPVAKSQDTFEGKAGLFREVDVLFSLALVDGHRAGMAGIGRTAKYSVCETLQPRTA